MGLDLTDDETKVLRELLTYALSEIRMEIADTDSGNYRQSLKDRKALYVRIAEKLGDTS
jgi:hypothetical protein